MKKILIIDDELTVREAFGIILRNDYDVAFSKGGQEALELVKECSPDLVIVDIIMPGMDGVEVVRKLKKMNCPSEIIVLTSCSMMKIAVEAVKIGACGYITKPLDVEEIKTVVERALQTADDKTPAKVHSGKVGKKELPFKEKVENFERGLIEDALNRAGWVQTKAAKLLKISRRMLKYKMDKLSIKG